jgi:hypothetical protein
MAADNYLRPQSDTRLAQKQNQLIALMFQVDSLAEELKVIEDQIALGGDWTTLAAELGYTGINAIDNVQAAYNPLGSLITVNLAGFYQQMLGRMG